MHTPKRYSSLIVISLVLINSMTFVYAETPANTPTTNTNSSCQACFNTSPYVDKYLDFGDEIIKTMLSYANKEGSALASKKSSSSGSDGSDFEKRLQSIADSLNEKAQTVVSAGFVGSLVTTEGAFLDSWKSMSVLMQSPAINRDRTKLDTLGQKIMNTLLDMGNAGVFIRLGFKEGFQERINSIILTYSTGANPIFTPVNGITNFNYAPADILTALWSMNQGLKTAVGAGGTDELFNTYLNDALEFSQSFRDELAGNTSTNTKGYYSCAQWLQGMTACSTLGIQAKDSAKAIRADTKKETKNATKIVTDAVKRLKAFMAQNGSVRNTTQRQDDYLRSQNGLQGVRNNEGDPLVGGFWESRQSVKNEITKASPIAGITKNTGKEKGNDFTVGDISTKVTLQNSNDVIAQAVNDSIDTAQSNRKTSIFAGVDPVTKSFPLITQEIMSAKYKIESTNTTAIIQNLGKACEAQCSNVAGKCWYDQ